MSRPAHAFTLVETLLAMAVSATLLLTVVSLLPAGLDASREGRNQAAETAIMQHLRHLGSRQDIRGDFCFDADGLPLPERDAQTACTARVLALEPLPLPGESAAVLRRLRITLLAALGRTRREITLTLAPPA
jgi:uncharacterized protein (TIGR02598 family)